MSGGGGSQRVESKLSPFQEKHLERPIEQLSQISDQPKSYIGAGYAAPTPQFGRGVADVDRAANFSRGVSGYGADLVGSYGSGDRDIAPSFANSMAFRS